MLTRRNQINKLKFPETGFYSQLIVAEYIEDEDTYGDPEEFIFTYSSTHDSTTTTGGLKVFETNKILETPSELPFKVGDKVSLINTDIVAVADLIQNQFEIKEILLIPNKEHDRIKAKFKNLGQVNTIKRIILK